MVLTTAYLNHLLVMGPALKCRTRYPLCFAESDGKYFEGQFWVRWEHVLVSWIGRAQVHSLQCGPFYTPYCEGPYFPTASSGSGILEPLDLCRFVWCK